MLNPETMSQSTSIRPGRALAAVVIVGVSLAMATAVDDGLTRDWPQWARALWGLTLISGCVGGALLGLTALGLLSDASLAARGDHAGRSPDTRTFLLVYVGFLAVGVALSLGLESQGISHLAVIMVYGGVTFLVSTLGRPWWLYATIRRMGWFGSIHSDTAMRVVLVLLGTLLLLAGFAMGLGGPR